MNETQPSRRPVRRTTPIPPVIWGLMIAFVITAGITAYLTFLAVRELVASRSSAATPPGLSLEGGTPGAPDAPLDVSVPLQPASGPTPQPWDGASRVTVLVMGLDYRDWEEEGPSRTDTMILFTLDPVARTAGILSIPRDLWVNIPGFDYGKINTAYYLGELYQLPGGGPGLAIQTVEALLGVPINYYAQIDFTAFENFIDEIGGVEIEVPYEMAVDPIGPDNTLTLEAGLQVLDGPTALAYARNRDTIGGDFDRAQRQQQVILAIRSQILNLDMLPTLITKAPVLYQGLSAGIHTNLSLQETIQLAWLAQQIPAENIARGAIGPDHVTITVSPDGLDILMPNPDLIRELRDEIFASTGTVSPVATVVVGDPEELRAAEAARVSVLNATTTPGLAASTAVYLGEQDINVTVTGNATEISSYTIIIDYSGKPYTVQYLVELMNIQPTAFTVVTTQTARWILRFYWATTGLPTTPCHE
jgi:LCP family protein required for cell wall assembly